MCDEYFKDYKMVESNRFNHHIHGNNVAGRITTDNNHYCEISSPSNQRCYENSCNCQEHRRRDNYPSSRVSSVAHGMMYPNEDQYYSYQYRQYNHPNNYHYSNYDRYYDRTEYYNSPACSYPPPSQHHRSYHPSDVSIYAPRTNEISPPIYTVTVGEKQEEYNPPSFRSSSCSPLVVSTVTTQDEDDEEERVLVENSSTSFNSSNCSVTSPKISTPRCDDKTKITTGGTIRSEIENDLRNIKASNDRRGIDGKSSLVSSPSLQINDKQDGENPKNLSTSPNNTKKGGKKCKMYSNYIGVTFNKTHGKYQACITHYRKQHYLGRYKLSTDAALAYDKGAKLLKGQGWKINFSSDDEYWAARCKEEQEKLHQNTSPTSASSTPKNNSYHIHSNVTNILRSSTCSDRERLDTENNMNYSPSYKSKYIANNNTSTMQQPNLVSPHNNNKRNSALITPSTFSFQPISAANDNPYSPSKTHNKKLKVPLEQPHFPSNDTATSPSPKVINETPSYILNNMLEAASALMTLNNGNSSGINMHRSG